MSKLKQFRELFNTSFKEDAAWTDWFFNSVVDAEGIFMLKDENGRPVSALLTQAYDFAYSGTVLPSVYISCVATRPEHRGKGLAGQLLETALRAAADNGAALAELIPARPHLYFFYDRMGFSTTFYADEQRFTELHTFSDNAYDGFYPAEPTHALLHRLESQTGCGVLHSRRDFDFVMHQNRLDGGWVAAVEGPRGAAAFLFAVPDNGRQNSEVTVKYLLATSEAAEEAVLAQLRRMCGRRPLRVLAKPENAPAARLRAAGMLRVLDVHAILGALAAAHPGLSQTMVVRDPLLERNNGVFSIRDGKCAVLENAPRHPDLDVDVTTLTKILFSAPATGNIFNLPTGRPLMAQMLD